MKIFAIERMWTMPVMQLPRSKSTAYARNDIMDKLVVDGVKLFSDT